MENASKRSDWPALPASLIVTFGAALLGMQFPPDAWYRALRRPEFAPPDAVFGPVWTLLYAAMAIAAWLVWRWRREKRVRGALLLYGMQLILNAAWSPLFFGAHWIGAALVDIVVLWAALLATLVLFWRVSRVAGGLLAPYLAWVSFAAVLNFEFWRLNQGA